MNEELALKLCDLNNRFYSSQARSFSDTRHARWVGWERCLKEALSIGDRASLTVLDVACGNLRFEEFLVRRLQDVSLRVVAFDVCDDLVPEECAGEKIRKHQTEIVPQLASSGYVGVDYVHCDVMKALSGSSSDRKSILDAPYLLGAIEKEKDRGYADLGVTFGFMHHVPLQEWRIELLNYLIDGVKSGGFVCVSLWRFMDSSSLAKKAQNSHKQALEFFCNQGVMDQNDIEELDEGDYFVGWRNTPGVFRYCHSFSDEQIDDLLLRAEERVDCVARFRADGRTNDLNEYLVLRVK